jgi:DNA anti-recombination protein RmuC
MTIDERIEFLLRSTESLHTNVHELYNNVHELYTSVHELRGIAQEHTTQLQQDAENIRSLARIAEAHGQRISEIEGNGETS